MGPDARQSRARANLGIPFLLVLLILSLVGCAPEPAPDLLEIDQVEPPALEQGSELRIVGMGFAEHREGTLTLEGTLYRPGRSPHRLNWSTQVEPETQSLTRLRLRDTHLSAILDGAHHGTFRGSVSLSFDPIMDRRPVLRGEREQVVLNFFSSAKSEPYDAESFASFLGLKLSSTFLIEEVKEDGRAAQAGLEVGDRLLTLDGVHLDSPEDFVPTPHVTTSMVSYSDKESSEILDTPLDRENFQILDATLTAQALAFALGLGAALLLIAKPPRFVIWILGRKTSAKKEPLRWLEGLSSRTQAVAYLLFALVVVGYFLVLRGGNSPYQSFDFLVCLSVGILLLLTSSFILGGASGRHRFSLLAAFGATSTSLLLLLPIVIAALCRSAEVGSLRLSEMDASQGLLPPSWGAVQSPWSLLLSLAYLLALIPLAGRRPPVFGKRGEFHRALLLGRSLEWLGALVLLALFLSLFLGAQLGKSQGSLVLQAGFFSLKLALLAYVLSVLRTKAGFLRSSEAWSLWGPANLLLSLLCAGLLLLSWTHWLAPVTAEVRSSFAGAMAACLLLFALVAQTRSWMQSGRRTDPWI